MRSSCVILIVSAIVLCAHSAVAQRGQGRGFGGRSLGGPLLLGQESVQKELELSAEQIKQVDEQLAKQREMLSGLRDLGREERQNKIQQAAKASLAALASILNEDQLERFKQIALQQRGGQAFSDSEVAAALDLTDEQKSRLGEIQSEARAEMRNLFQGAASGDRQAMRKKFQEARAAANEKLTAVLTPEQQAKWKKMTGEPFTGQIRRGFRGGNRGGTGPPGDRPRRNRDATSTGGATGANRPRAAAGPFHLASFRPSQAGSDNGGDAKESDAKKSKAEKTRSPRAKGHSRDARRRGRRGPERFGRADSSRARSGDRDRAWARVARVMRQRGHRSGRQSMAHGRPGRRFARGPHRDHGPRMAWGGRPSSARAGHRVRFAAFDHHRGHRPWAHARARSGRSWNPTMAHHRGQHGRGYTRAGSGGFRGPYKREMAHRTNHHGHWRHAVQARHYHARRVSFAGHRSRGPMRMAGYKRHGRQGPDAGKQGPWRRDDSSFRSCHHRRDDERKGERNRRRDRDRDSKRNRDRDRDDSRDDD